MGNLGVALGEEGVGGTTEEGVELIHREIIAWDSHRGEAAQEGWRPAL